MPTSVRSLLGAVVVTTAAVACGVAVVGPEEQPEAAPPPEPPAITLAELDTTTIAVDRAGFCPEVAVEEVAAALGAEPAEEASYVNGERADLTPRTTDVAHEFGCSWTAAGGSTARGWVFAPPVTADRARGLARAAVRARGCKRLPAAAEFGTTGAATRCTGRGTTTITYQGLFGDAWLSCTLRDAATAPDLEARASRWCAAVVVAGSAEIPEITEG